MADPSHRLQSNNFPGSLNGQLDNRYSATTYGPVSGDQNVFNGIHTNPVTSSGPLIRPPQAPVNIPGGPITRTDAPIKQPYGMQAPGIRPLGLQHPGVEGSGPSPVQYRPMMANNIGQQACYGHPPRPQVSVPPGPPLQQMNGPNTSVRAMPPQFSVPPNSNSVGMPMGVSNGAPTVRPHLGTGGPVLQSTVPAQQQPPGVGNYTAMPAVSTPPPPLSYPPGASRPQTSLPLPPGQGYSQNSSVTPSPNVSVIPNPQIATYNQSNQISGLGIQPNLPPYNIRPPLQQTQPPIPSLQQQTQPPLPPLTSSIMPGAPLPPGASSMPPTGMPSTMPSLPPSGVSSQGPLLPPSGVVHPAALSALSSVGPAGRRQYPVSQQPQMNQPAGFIDPRMPATAAVPSGTGQPPVYYPQNSQMQPMNQAHLQDGYGVNQLNRKMGSLGMRQGSEAVDLLQVRNILPPKKIEAPKIVLPMFDYKQTNCSPDLMRCTLTKIPESNSVLQKVKLPFGILIHPFKDLTNLQVIQCNTIVRCRTCRTYINPFVYFVDQRRWKCNLCYRVNELPEEFQYDPVSKTYGDPSRRPEIKSATIEFIAPSEYMLRPPQPSVYLFVLDVSYNASETGYLKYFCDVLLEELDRLPGDSRTQVGFITYDSTIHFYNLAEGLSQPHMIVVSDIDDVFLPCPDNLLVNLQESKELVKDLLQHLPVKFLDNREPDSALGSALQAAFKLTSPTGGRITVIQTCLPNVGPGALKPREDPNQRAGKEVHNLGPANDFYKKLSLDCSGQQVAVDLFILSSQYSDVATLSCISKFSGGCIYYYPGFHSQLNHSQVERFEKDLHRYLSRKIGFEAVMRIRCTKGLAIHTFHGNFFVRSTDLLSLPNINPDAGFAIQVSVEDALTESNMVCFQAALLYTSSKGERRIRVHTLCLPTTTNVHDIILGCDQQAIIGLLCKMAVDRSVSSSLSDAREALINACADALTAYKICQNIGTTGLQAPHCLALVPLYILAILKHLAFRIGTSTRLDERVYAMNQLKTLPLSYLLLYIYPNLYPVHILDDQNCIMHEDIAVPQPPILHLSSEKIDSTGAYLLDAGDRLIMYVCTNISEQFCQNVLNVRSYASISEIMFELPELETPESERLRNFVNYLQSQRPFHAAFSIIRFDSKNKNIFLQHLIEDRTESTYSYYEFLQHIKEQVAK